MTDETSRAPRRRLLLGAAAAAAVGALVVALTTGSPDEPGDRAASSAAPATSAPGTSTPTTTEAPSTATSAPEAAAPTSGAEPEVGDATGVAPGQPGPPTPTERLDGRSQSTVPLDQPAEVRTGVTARISQLEAVQAEANLPGEIGGPGLRVTVEVRNDSPAPVDLATAVVNAYVGPDARPLVPVLTGSEPFPPDVPSGGTATARVVFTVPVEDRGDLRLELDLGAGNVIALFTGSAAGV